MGIIIGAIPGLGPALGVAIIIPFTLKMDTVPALLFAISVYDGAMYGGSISSILLNTPGDASAAATTIEGYPMAKQGKAIDALMACGVASALGGVIGDIIVIAFCTVIGGFILLFGTPEYFLLECSASLLFLGFPREHFSKELFPDSLAWGLQRLVLPR